MTELSFFVRLVLTLIFSALSLFFYKWLQKPSRLPSGASTKRSKKRKKKSAKKSAASDSLSPNQELPEKSPPSAASEKGPIAADQTGDVDDVSESESDDDRSAAEVLATRKFKPASLGGSRLARKIKSSLPSTDVRFAVDQKVLARFEGGDRWFPATVLEQRKGNEYHLKYDDGEVEFRVPAEFIKLQPEKSEEEGGDSEESDALQAVEAERVEEEAAVQGEASDSGSSASEDDGWQVVGTSKRQARRVQVASPAEPLVSGLTKRQRENRRKKERQREKKELLRQHAQKDDLDACARWRYVPS